MFLPFLNITVYDIPQLLWALLNGRPPSTPIGPQPETPSAPGPGVPASTEPDSATPGAEPLPPTGQQPNVPSQGEDLGTEVPLPRPDPRLFALIIGINNYKYPGVHNLLGAVPDADAVRDYLQEQLGVPNSQIINLRDSQATRAAILHEINALMNDKRIQKGDPILIYYSGHGASALAPPNWEAGGSHIQLLVPHDQSCIDRSGRQVLGIPDRTLGVLLARLAHEKGDNISVILDCCHSGSGTRTDEIEPTRLVRGIKVEHIPVDLDEEIWATFQPSSSHDRATAIAAGFTHSGLASHVLLAACGAEEFSYEEEGRGLFTKALVDALVSYGADKLTYADVVQRMASLPKQNPQCEGVNQSRILFNARAADQRPLLYKIRKDGNQYLMSAGAAHGVAAEAQFAVYRDWNSSLKGESLGTVTARLPGPFHTILDAFPKGSDFALETEGLALQTRAGAEEDLRLHIVMDEMLVTVFEALGKEMQRTDPARRSIMLVEKEKAELDIALENGSVVFNILNPLVTQYGLTRMPFVVEPTVDAVQPVIRAAAHFYWHLRRKSAKGVLQKWVDIEFTQLIDSEEEYDDELQPVLRPYGPNLNRDNVIDLRVKDSARYGLKITNRSNVALYPALFYFDNSDLSIESYYQPPTANGIVDPPLRGKDSLTIGYGDSGSPPQRFFLRDGQKLDVGLLKLFLSTEYVDLSHIPQPSPFGEGRGSTPDPVKPHHIWDTILVPLIQRSVL
ncbi:uncharacterized protein FIBRA_02547 [Fibroporia radiculosa]|uniref:Peptidase C14 caspase domain-containing protein n=1 Tax=Fibroporia radiculosa TaxID=599839 RepID=J4G1U3_9APHY|nr:uncharacterized protein FIBRA_02547 [Fibroporia radiculosa]CCM00513.1 predicted protein [Fibroporia radiculosa]